MKDCIFCQMVRNELPCKKIYECADTLAFLDIFPNSEGHCLVIPKQHFADFSSTSEKELKAVAVAKAKVVEILKEKLPNQPVGFNFISNQGAEAFQQVFHYHEHIVPKYKMNDGYKFLINKNKNDLSVEEVYQNFLED